MAATEDSGERRCTVKEGPAYVLDDSQTVFNGRNLPVVLPGTHNVVTDRSISHSVGSGDRALESPASESGGVGGKLAFLKKRSRLGRLVAFNKEAITSDDSSRIPTLNKTRDSFVSQR
jgi:hypothetical protein